MPSMKGEDLVKICSLYENYKFRTQQRLLHASSRRQLENTAGQTLRPTERRKEQACQDYCVTNGTESGQFGSRRHLSGTLQIKCGQEVCDANIICRLGRCRIGEEEKVYKHYEPPLLITSSKLPPIPKQIQGKNCKTTPAKLHQSLSKELRREAQDALEARRAAELGPEDDDVIKGKKVSFGGTRIMSDKRCPKTWDSYRTNVSPKLQHPSSRYKVLGEDFGQDSKVPVPRRGRLHVRFPGKRGRPGHPATARLKAEDRHGIQPTVPLTGVSILKPAKPFMVIPTPCFPCSPEFERTFKILRDQKK